METLLVTVKDPKKKNLLLALLAEFDFVEVGILSDSPPAEGGAPAIVGYAADGTPVRSDQLVRDAAADIEAAKQGDAIELDDYLKETREWLDNIE